MVQGSTRLYQEVPSSTKAVQEGTKLYQNGSMQYRQVHTGMFWIVVQQYFLVHKGMYCFVLIFLLNQVMLAYRNPCNAARLNALYSRSMQAQARFNEHWDLQVLLLFCPLPPYALGGRRRRRALAGRRSGFRRGGRGRRLLFMLSFFSGAGAVGPVCQRRQASVLSWP